MKNRLAYGSNGHQLDKPRFVRKEAKKANIEGYSHELMTKIGPIRCVDKEWYQYRHGVWKEISEAIFLPTAWKIINTRSERGARQVLDAVRAQTQIEKGELFGAVRTDEEGFLINCANGVVRIDKEGEAELVGHNRKYMFTLQIDSNFSKARCPRFLETLRETLPAHENRVLLLDIAASCLMPDSRFQAMLFCTGSGGNGKSTIWEAIARSFGQEVVARINYHDICANNRKYVWKLERMLLNLGTETQGKPIGENAIVKAIVCGEAFDTDKIYQDSFRMKTNVKLVFATNYQLRYEQGSDAEIRRTRIIHFGKQFETTTRGLELEHVLTAEKDGIFSMLVRRLAKLLKKTRLCLGDKLSQLVYNQFKCSNNPVIEFEKACLKTSPGSRLLRQDMWICYKKFSLRHEYSPYSMQAFFRKLYQNFPKYQLDESRTRLKGVQVWVVRNVTFTELGGCLMELDRDS